MTKLDGNVSKFYNSVGWESHGDNTEDALRFEDLRDCASEYISLCRLRVLEHIPGEGENLLDMASGPIQYKEYLQFSKNFKKRYCVDLSSKALGLAKEKIGTHGEFLHGNFLDMDLEDNFFDCSISLHTIYHIDQGLQESAVRKLLTVTKAGSPVIIIYSNPDNLLSWLGSLMRSLKHRFSRRVDSSQLEESEHDLYFFTHPLGWWNRFEDVAKTEMHPWRSLASHHQKKLIPDNLLGRKMLGILYTMESRFPDFFVKNFQYYMVILRKL